MSIKINNKNIVALYKGEQSIAYVYKGIDLVWRLVELGMDDDIFFVDPEVGRVLYANGLIADPVKSSRRELATITSLNPDGYNNTGYFYNNKVVKRFPELKYCTGLSSLDKTFDGCINLTNLTIPDSITSVDLYNSNIQNVKLSNTTIYSKLWLPSSLTELKLLNSVGDFKIKSATNLTSIWIENTSNVNGFTLALATTANNSGSLQKLRLIGIDETNKYNQLMGLSELIGISSTGSSTSIGQAVTGSLYEDEIYINKYNEITNLYPNLNVTYGEMLDPLPEGYVLAKDSDFSGTKDGEFVYIGSDEYVVIPKVIKGVTVTKTTNMFGRDASIVKGVATRTGHSITNTWWMFSYFKGNTLNLTNFNTSNVTNMQGMFANSEATTIDLSNWDTSNVTNMKGMFSRSKTTILNLTSFNTSKVTNFVGMFYQTKTTRGWARTQEDANSFNDWFTTEKPSNLRFTVGVPTIEYFNPIFIIVDFGTLESEIQLPTEVWATMSDGFLSSYTVTEAWVSEFYNSQIQGEYEFTTILDGYSITATVTVKEELVIPSYYVLATDADFSGEADGQFKYIGSDDYVIVPKVIKGVIVTTVCDNPHSITYGLFTDTYVKGVILQKGNSITNMDGMFYQSKATTLDLNYLDTSSVIGMNYMFMDTVATSINLSGFFNTRNVISMHQMFYQSKATTLDLTSFDTSNVKYFAGMFAKCSATTLILLSFDTRKALAMNNMFEDTKVTTLDLSSFDITNMNVNPGVLDMFKNTKARIGYARTVSDRNKFNDSKSSRPAGLTFVVKE